MYFHFVIDPRPALHILHTIIGTDKTWYLSQLKKCVTTKYPCHHLLFRSAVFKAIMVNDVLERQTGRIELLDVEVKTGKDLLFFMYSGKMKEGSDLPGLLVLADKYGIEVNCYV
jgi:hypothetical protein